MFAVHAASQLELLLDGIIVHSFSDHRQGSRQCAPVECPLSIGSQSAQARNVTDVIGIRIRYKKRRPKAPFLIDEDRRLSTAGSRHRL